MSHHGSCPNYEMTEVSYLVPMMYCRRCKRVRPPVVAATHLVGALRLDGHGLHVRQPHRHLDRDGAEADEDGHKHLHR